MRLIAIHHRSEGETIRTALITAWHTYVVYDGIAKLRGIGLALMLPVPTFFKYYDACTAELRRGMRFPRVMWRIGFLRGEKRKPMFSFMSGMQPVGRQVIIATRTEIEDGLYPVRTTTKGEANVQAN